MRAGEVPGRLRVTAEMMAWSVGSLDTAQLARTCMYNWPEPLTRDLAWVARHTLHEAVHHLDDVRRILRA